MASAQIPRLYHSTAALLPDGRVITTGGEGYTQTEIYEPPYLFSGPRPTIGSAPGNVTYRETFFVDTPDALNIAQVTWIRFSSVTCVNMDQRFSRLSFSHTAGGLNVVAPAGPNVAPPGYYMLFILNGAGVPSVAKTVHIAGTPSPSPPDTLL
jgi:galactose oxidase